MKKQEIKPDIVGLINEMQQQLVNLEKKIDILISKPVPKPAEERSYPKPFQQPSHIHSYNERRQENSYRERILHKAICADCRKGCEVPFRPSGERPVYCQECFSRRKAGNSFKERPNDRSNYRSRDTGFTQAIHVGKPQSDRKKKFGEKKNFTFKRRKAKMR